MTNDFPCTDVRYCYCMQFLVLITRAGFDGALPRRGPRAVRLCWASARLRLGAQCPRTSLRAWAGGTWRAPRIVRLDFITNSSARTCCRAAARFPKGTTRDKQHAPDRGAVSQRILLAIGGRRGGELGAQALVIAATGPTMHLSGLSPRTFLGRMSGNRAGTYAGIEVQRPSGPEEGGFGPPPGSNWAWIQS